MSIICHGCGYERNPPNAQKCEVCSSELSVVTPQPQQPSLEKDLSIETSLPKPPLSYTGYPTSIDIQPATPQIVYDDPPPPINIQPATPQIVYDDPPPPINIQPATPQIVYDDQPPLINIQPAMPQPPYFEQTPSNSISSAMNIKCPQCGYDSNLPSTEFCEVCGYELSSIALNSHQHSEPAKIEQEPNYPSYFQAPTTEIQPPEAQTSPSSISPSINAPIPVSSIQTIKLISKQAGSPTSEFVLEDSNIIGRFDPDLGPVEIDLEGFLGADYISRNHAEIYREGNQWKIKDLGSENGVFLKRVDQTRFSARITTPEILNIGDEVAFGKIRFVLQSS